MSLMAIDSTSGREGEMIAFTESRLQEWGWPVTRIPVSQGRDCLFAGDPAAARVVLSTHLDTVPPYIPPVHGSNALYGRGACDAKGIAAAMICAADELRSRDIGVGLLFLVGEETSHDGASAANAWARANFTAEPRALIGGEPTESTLAAGTKGAMRVVLRTHGKAAHSAYPELGESAISKLVALLAELNSLALPVDPTLGPTTVNIGAISGGVADNVIAPWAEARLMARLVTSAEDMWKLIERWVDGRADLERGAAVPPMKLATLEGFPVSVAAFATDIPALNAWGTPYLFGPGSVHVAHTPNEQVRIDELECAVSTYVKIALGAIEQLGSVT